jgi:acyl-CoA-binding protein
MTLEEAFQDAVERVSLLPKQPNHTLLKLYSLYKQATVGDVSGSRPGALDLKGRAKYDAWASRKGTGQEDAMTDYIEFCEELGA